jgi:zinc transporter, ZIP family
MLEAILLGAGAQSSLIVSGLVAHGVKVPPKVIGALAGLGAGALVSAVAFDLIPEGEALHSNQLTLWLLAGAVFVVSDRIVEARFGSGGASGAIGHRRWRRLRSWPTPAGSCAGWSSCGEALLWRVGSPPGVGYLVAEGVGTTGGRAAALAAGGLLAMLTDSLMP